MSNEREIQQKLQKTALLFAAINLMLLPLHALDSALALTVAIVVNAIVLNQLNELGKHRRAGSNALSRASNFFSSAGDASAAENYNIFRNIINGGAAVVDDLAVRMNG